MNQDNSNYSRPSGPPPTQPSPPNYTYQQQQEPQYQSYESNPNSQEQSGWSGYRQQHELQDLEKGSDLGSYKPDYTAEYFDDAFKVQKPKFNDWPFAIFFCLVLFGFIAVAVITIRAYRLTGTSTQGSGIYGSGSGTLNTNSVIAFMMSILIAVVFSMLEIGVARMAPRKFITIGLICNVVVGLATSIAYLALGYYSAGIVFLIFTVIAAWCYWTCRHRIPFSGTVLSIVIDVMRSHPSILIVSIIGTVVSVAFSVLFSITIVSTYIKYSDNSAGCLESGGSCSHSKVVGVLVFVFFAGYYISEVIRNVIHTTISGIYGTWYYLYKSDQGEPKHAALGALKRAVTYSFGSICEGSLIVALISLLRQGLNVLRQNASAAGQGFEVCIICFIDFFVGILEWLVRWFNHYAYSYIALYGGKYTKASKDVFEMLRYKGFDALINDCLIGTALNFYNLFVAYVAALFVFLYLRYTAPSYNSSGGFYGPMVAFSFLISGQISNIVNTFILSGTSTFFLSLARDPEVFRLSYPEKFDEVFRNYPEVLQKLNLPNSN